MTATNEDPAADIAGLSHALAQSPNDPVLYGRRGNALLLLKRYDEALADIDRALELKPDFVPALKVRANCFLSTGRYREALETFERVIGLNPRDGDAYSNRGIALFNLALFDEALASYTTAITLRSDGVETHYNAGLLHLLRGDFPRGLSGHEWRLKSPSWMAAQPWLAVTSGRPRWTGAEDLSGKTILLQAEQGLGDTIQFCRYAKLVAVRGARVLLEVPGRLHGLLQGLEGVTRLIARGEPLPSFDYHCPLMSLPYALGTRLETIPAQDRYLAADPDEIVSVTAKLPDDGRLRVGLAWAGASGHLNDRDRSMPLSGMLEALPEGVQCINLSRDVRDDDLQLLGSDGRILNEPSLLQGFSPTAAVISLVDVVISVDTSIAHLAGALGHPTWLLLSRVPDWRWLLNRDDSPWYPSLRLFRQASPGDWGEVVAAVRRELQALVIQHQSA